jgi:hypothetical protein
MDTATLVLSLLYVGALSMGAFGVYAYFHLSPKN